MMLKSFQKRRTRRNQASFLVTLSVLGKIRDTIGRLPAERGGVLGGRSEDGIVSEFYFDREARRNTVTYTPDEKLLNRLFAEDWNPRGIRVLGFAHSHLGLRRLSRGDLSYSQRILEAIPDLKRLLTPIVISAADGDRFEFLPYGVVQRDGHVEVTSVKMIVIDDQKQRIKDWETALIAYPATDGSTKSAARDNRAMDAENAASDDSHSELTNSNPVVARVSGAGVSETFRRVIHAYDLDRMRESRVICVGAGGAAGYIEDLGRAGVGQFVLIDPDTVSETNLATQQAYRRDIGRAKVDAIADRLKDLNPDLLVVPLKLSLDEIDDRAFEFYALAHTEHRSVSQSLICGLTDNFYAQARVNRLALQFGLPSLCAQVYREGRGAEVTFTHPDVTPACHRCVLSSRYCAYLGNGFKNTVTSDGTPIFATTRLNALKGYVTMALLHQGSADPRWGSLLTRIGHRNLIQIRLDPDLASTVGIRVFDKVFEQADSARIIFDETVWLPQKPEGPMPESRACPDCRGTGNLMHSVGTFSDTRVMRE